MVTHIDTILAIDDSPQYLNMLRAVLSPRYRVLLGLGGEEGLRLAQGAEKPDLVLLDVNMPGENGYEVLAKLRESGCGEIPIIFLTGQDRPEDEERGLEAGAADYVSKPISSAILLARVRNQLEMKRVRDWLKSQNAVLEEEVSRRMAENDLTQKAAIRALAHLAEMRDSDTGDHVLRTQRYIELLADLLRDHPRFSQTLTQRYIDLLVRSAPLHDIGKVGVPDHILRKPGKLTDEEWEIMKTHAKLGSDAIESAERDLDRPVEFLALAKEIAHWHHERWDGEGYPDGLAGEAIPLSARMMAVADVFDALAAERVYKERMPLEQARRIIAEGRGSHFDPDIVDVFLAQFDSFMEIAMRCDDQLIETRPGALRRLNELPRDRARPEFCDRDPR
ncbi:HD-GYP domain-containing protein [Methylocystis heyeri]|uniref:Response regulator n=1 Tax=Methylocystis heyeri TaxID=391905 RepID=A0A6B8KKK5_9HYPH|nr:HD domain-containing phosphohydrolase [Methylocystis heyeri]QGM47465.1 response regulator [Methylocystis heyeri]